MKTTMTMKALGAAALAALLAGCASAPPGGAPGMMPMHTNRNTTMMMGGMGMHGGDAPCPVPAAASAPADMPACPAAPRR